jgi:hypothetical protein
MTFNWRSYIDALSANVQRVYSKNGAKLAVPLAKIPTHEKVEFLVQRTAKASVHSFEGALTDLPAANPEKEANDIALLLLGKLLEVLKGTHFACADSQVSSLSPTKIGLKNSRLMEAEKAGSVVVRSGIYAPTSNSCC